MPVFLRIIISKIPQNFNTSTFRISAPVQVVLLKIQFQYYLSACVLVSLCSPFHFFVLHFVVEFTSMDYFCFCRFGCYFSFFGVLLPHFFKGVTGCVWSYPEYCNVVYSFALFYCTLTHVAPLYFTSLHFTFPHFTFL